MTPILNHYFARINWLGAAAVNIDTLRALHLKHNCTIPFENLDVLLPREIQLDDQSLEEKLVTAHRGGYCFEQNGVFERVLRELGFNVRSLLGRVVLSNPPALPPRTHRLLLVELEEEKWIADVGFGGQTLTAPIRLVPDPCRSRHTESIGCYRRVMIGCCSLIIISTGSRCTVLISASSNKAIM